VYFSLCGIKEVYFNKLFAFSKSTSSSLVLRDLDLVERNSNIKQINKKAKGANHSA
jgi:hypothetical protein